MKCAEFLAGFSDFRDAGPSFEGRVAFEEHMASCPSCARYLAVVQDGVGLLRELPAAPLRDDFRERLQYTIYRFEEENRPERNALGAAPVMFLVAAAAVFAVWIGAPQMLEPDPSVELAPIVVRWPLEPESYSSSSLSVADSPSLRPEEASWLESSDLWAESNVLLYEHSQLFQRYREPGLVRTGLR